MEDMDNLRSDVENGRVGPTDKPDDPLAAARRKAKRRPMVTPSAPLTWRRKAAPPTPDQEGCYYLG